MNKLHAVIICALLFSACTPLKTLENTPAPVQPTIAQPTATPIAQQIPSTWKTYTNAQLGVSFSYPPEYAEPNITNNELISLISPLEANKSPKQQEGLASTELKVEIYVTKNYTKTIEEAAIEQDEQAKQNNTTFEIQDWRTLAGTKAYYRKGSGLGTFENYFVISNNKLYTIAKYPDTTSRQPEFELFLQSLKFI